MLAIWKKKHIVREMIMMINYPIMKTAILLMDFCNAFFFYFYDL